MQDSRAWRKKGILLTSCPDFHTCATQGYAHVHTYTKVRCYFHFLKVKLFNFKYSVFWRSLVGGPWTSLAQQARSRIPCIWCFSHLRQGLHSFFMWVNAFLLVRFYNVLTGRCPENWRVLRWKELMLLNTEPGTLRPWVNDNWKQWIETRASFADLQVTKAPKSKPTTPRHIVS